MTLPRLIISHLNLIALPAKHNRTYVQNVKRKMCKSWCACKGSQEMPTEKFLKSLGKVAWNAVNLPGHRLPTFHSKINFFWLLNFFNLIMNKRVAETWLSRVRLVYSDSYIGSMVLRPSVGSIDLVIPVHSTCKIFCLVRNINLAPTDPTDGPCPALVSTERLQLRIYIKRRIIFSINLERNFHLEDCLLEAIKNIHVGAANRT